MTKQKRDKAIRILLADDKSNWTLGEAEVLADFFHNLDNSEIILYLGVDGLFRIWIMRTIKARD